VLKLSLLIWKQSCDLETKVLVLEITQVRFVKVLLLVFDKSFGHLKISCQGRGLEEKVLVSNFQDVLQTNLISS
jgi:hypothetical protein